MQLGMIGLGRMGGSIVRRLMRHGHDCVVYDRDAKATAALAADGAREAVDLADLVGALATPRAVWVMLPAGEPTRQAVGALAGLLAPGDTVIDGGNTFWKEDIVRARELREKGIAYLDAGTSGGVWGLERGYCLTIGGDKPAAARARRARASRPSSAGPSGMPTASIRRPTSRRCAAGSRSPTRTAGRGSRPSPAGSTSG